MSNEIRQLMGLHSCFRGLDDRSLADIAEQMVVVRCEADECIHPANELLTDIFFVIQGSLKLTFQDFQGKEQLFRIVSRDEQFGALAAVLAEPFPTAVVARQRTTLLKLDFKKGQELTKKYPAFRLNVLGSVANGLREIFFEPKIKPQPAILTIFHGAPATRPLTQRLVRRLVELGERVCVVSDRDDGQATVGATFALLREVNREMFASEIREHLERCSGAQRILIEVDAALAPVQAARLIEFSDAVIWCARPEDERATVERLQATGSLATGCRDKTNLVWVLPQGCQASPAVAELNDLVARHFSLTLFDPQRPLGKTLSNGVERLVHSLRGVQIGLALGGGAARGMAHLGVLQALEQHGIVVDMLAGTSAGALTGIPYAAGLAADHLAQLFAKDLTPTWPFRYLPRPDQLYLLHQFRRGRFDGMLRKYLSNWRLEQLPIPCSAVTVDLVSGEVVVRDRGDAVHAILESINLPVLSVPIIRDGRALVDGGLVKNIPADVLVQKGCNFVIAVSVTAKIELEFASNRPDTPTARMRPASTLQTVMRSFLVQSMNINSFSVRPADVVIEPDVTEFSLTGFSRAKELAAVGEQATLPELPPMKKLLQQLDERLFDGVKEAAHGEANG